MNSSTRTSSHQARTSLPIEIHTATRSYHKSLNRLITSRLPLCLPPYASDASVYLCGISAFATIYLTFESEWASILSPTENADVSPRIQNLLKALHHPPLLRTARLSHDISLLSRNYTNHERLPSPIFATTHISKRIQSHPHVLLAYTWIMYQALFNGGRWIRSQLLPTSNIPRFWPEGVKAEDCLTFWYFDSAQDGEDIKNDFKTTFEAVAVELTMAERQDVIEEAVEIFKICGTIVENLDTAFTANSETQATPAALTSLAPLSLPLVWVLTGQLYDILVWLWNILPTAPGRAHRVFQAGHRMVLRERR